MAAEHDHDHSHDHGHDHDHSHDHGEHTHDHDGGVSVAESAAEQAAGDQVAGEQEAGQDYRLTLQVEVSDAGPCRKHVKVRVPRQDIEHFREEVVGELENTAMVPGFRPGHVPRSLIERRFRKEVSTHVKQQVLLRSLDQVANENKLDAINEPDLDFESLEIPEEGDFTYEFHVEVRPAFDLPDYSGLKIKRPVRDITEADVDAMLNRYLEQFAQLKPLEDETEPAKAGDYVATDVVATHNGRDLIRKEREQIRIRPTLQFQDAVIADFDKLMVGATQGTTKTAETTISLEADKIELRGEKVTITFTVQDVLRQQLPELNEDFLRQVGAGSVEELRAEVKSTLERQLDLEQRQAARRQVLEQITDSANWDLPESLVSRQVENARRRDWLEMHQAGYSDEQIRTREGEMLNSRLSSTRQALKEHFVLDKIATEEKLQVTPQDVEDHIRYMAFQRGENPRKVRARLEKQGLMENLTAQILEELSIEFLLDKAQFEDVPEAAKDEGSVEALDIALAGAGAAEQNSLTALQEAAEREKANLEKAGRSPSQK